MVTKQLYSGKRFRVDEIQGKEIVVHPGAVVILPLIDPQHIVMIQNHRVAVNQVLWELPAGTLEESEFPLMCAKRELEEETGFRAKNFKELTWFYTTPGFTDEKITAFVATDLKQTKQKLDPGEQITVEIISFTQALDMMKKGQIVDAKTILTLLYYALY